MVIAFIAAGGAAGALARYAVVCMFGGNLSLWSTLVVNITGSFAIGFLAASFSTGGALPRHLRPLLITGFLGAYTTFSAFSLETVLLLKNGNFKLAALNFMLTNAFCFAAVVLGFAAAKALHARV